MWINPGDADSYEEYIQRALHMDLQSAGIFSAEGKLLSARLDVVDVNVPVGGNGSWVLELTVSDGVHSVTAKGNAFVAAAWDASIVCANASASFHSAVEDLIGNLFSAPGFAQLSSRAPELAKAEGARLDYGAKKKALDALRRLDADDARGAIELLLGILNACGENGSCSSSVRAGLYMYIGVAQGTGIGEQADARKSFALARALDPSCPLDASRADKQTAGTYLSVFGRTEPGFSVMIDDWRKDVAQLK